MYCSWLGIFFVPRSSFDYPAAGVVRSSGRDLVCCAGQLSMGMAGRGKMAKPKHKYTVYVDDNYHCMDESERYKLGDFATLDEAIEACKRSVDQFLVDETSLDGTAAERYAQYTGFGPDPFIVTDDPDVGPPPFSAWSYAKERCEQG